MRTQERRRRALYVHLTPLAPSLPEVAWIAVTIKNNSIISGMDAEFQNIYSSSFGTFEHFSENKRTRFFEVQKL